MLASLIAFAVLDAGPTCRTADSRVEEAIAAQVRASGGNEYCQHRLYDMLDDVDGDGREDFVVVFTVEAPAGGNDSVQHLAVFPSASGWRPALTTVGRRGQRFIDSIGVGEGRAIVLGTQEYAKGDAMCCPSRTGELRYRLAEGRLVP